MKTLVLTISLILSSISLSFSQINLFGVNISKYADSKADLVYRKLDCAKNPYYTFAEYKNYPKKNMKFIMFDDFGAKDQTAQMLDPKSYLTSLSSEISKILGQDFKVYKDKNLTDPINDQYYWILKQNDKFIVAKLFYSTFSQRNNLRIFIFDNESDLAFGFANLTKAEGKNSNTTMFYSEEGLTKVTKSTNDGSILSKL
jgi:hypothetical protein